MIKSKVGLLALAQTLGNVSQACKVMGYSRDSFYRFKELYETGGALAMQEISRKKPVVKNRVDAEIEKAVVALAVEQPASGQVRAAHELKQRGVFISPGGVRCKASRIQRRDLRERWYRSRTKTVDRRVRENLHDAPSRPISAFTGLAPGVVTLSPSQATSMPAGSRAWAAA